MRIEPLGLMPANAGELVDSSRKVQDGSFSHLLSEALGTVNHIQLEAEQASIHLAAGKVEDVSQVIVATEKASVALQLTMQVRNKVVDAYQEIMRMQM